MKPPRLTLARAARGAGLLAALLAPGCSSPPPPAPARVVAPPASAELVLPAPSTITICQRGALPTTGADAATIASFESFSRDWMTKMRSVAAARFAIDRKRLRETYEMELRSTGSAQAPYVGVLSYCEVKLQCASDASCKPASSTVVKEMFRLQAGQWVY